MGSKSILKGLRIFCFSFCFAICHVTNKNTAFSRTSDAYLSLEPPSFITVSSKWKPEAESPPESCFIVLMNDGPLLVNDNLKLDNYNSDFTQMDKIHIAPLTLVASLLDTRRCKLQMLCKYKKIWFSLIWRKSKLIVKQFFFLQIHCMLRDAVKIKKFTVHFEAAKQWFIPKKLREHYKELQKWLNKWML